MTAEEIWNAWVGVPDIDPGDGMSRDWNYVYSLAAAGGYRVFANEWNWNGWNQHNRPMALESSFCHSIGAAGFLHSFIREGSLVAGACQSMLVGDTWNITGIRADPTGVRPAYYFPMAQVTTFYNHHHGSEVLTMDDANIPRYSQPFSINWLPQPESAVAYLDAVATASSDTVYVHVINRRFSAEETVTINLDGFSGLGSTATWNLFQGRLNDAPKAWEPKEMAWTTASSVALGGNSLTVTLPRRSVSIFEIPCVR